MELGPRDVELKQFVSVTRDIGKKETNPLAGAADKIKKIMEEMHQRMLNRQVILKA